MDGLVTSVILLAAFMHAVWNAFLKADDDKLLSIASIVVATGIMALCFVPFVDFPARESWPYLALSVAAHSTYYVFLSQSYRLGEFAQVYPIARGTAPLLVTLWSVLVLHETLTPLQLGTVAGIIFGIMVFASRGFDTLIHDRQLFLFIFLTSLSIGVYTIADGNGARLSQNVAGYMLWLSVFDVFPILLFTLSRRPVVKIVKYTFKIRAFFVGGISLIAYWMVVWAMTQAPIPLVAALRETSIIIATLIGAFYFKEKSGYRRFIAAVIICISVAILKIYD